MKRKGDEKWAMAMNKRALVGEPRGLTTVRCWGQDWATGTGRVICRSTEVAKEKTWDQDLRRKDSRQWVSLWG